MHPSTGTGGHHRPAAGAGACSRKASFALGLGLSADGFHLKKHQQGYVRATSSSASPQRSSPAATGPAALPSSTEARSHRGQRGGPGLGIDLQSAI